jgi:hypothetical protein
MDTLQSLLARANSNKAILFCGAGFTADCINFESEEDIGASANLLNILSNYIKEAGFHENFLKISRTLQVFSNRTSGNINFWIC